MLPIEDLGGDTSQAYIAEGLTDELVTDLAQVKGLQVINRHTMQVYAKSGKTPKEIARELGVDAVVTGTLQRLGDTVHLTAQVTRTGTDRALWAQSYGGDRRRPPANSEGDRLGGRRPTAGRRARAPPGPRRRPPIPTRSTLTFAAGIGGTGEVRPAFSKRSSFSVRR